MASQSEASALSTPAGRVLADPELRDEIDALFQLPLSGFTSAKNQLAAKYRSRDRERAAGIKAVSKPSLSAWAVNQAYWRAPRPFDQMLDAGEALRKLQTAAMNGAKPASLADAAAALRASIGPVLQAAQAALRDGGHGQTQTVLRRVSTTLDALAAYGRAVNAPPAGRLSTDVAAPGFNAVAGLGPVRPRAATRAAATALANADQDPIHGVLKTGPNMSATSAMGIGTSAPAVRAAVAIEAAATLTAGMAPAADEAGPAATTVTDASAPPRPETLVAAAIQHLAEAEYAELAAQTQLSEAEAAVNAARAALAQLRAVYEQRAQTLQQLKAATGRARRSLRAAKQQLEASQGRTSTGPASSSRHDPDFDDPP